MGLRSLKAIFRHSKCYMIQTVKICTQSFNSFVSFLNNKISLCRFFKYYIKNVLITSKKAKAQDNQARTWRETRMSKLAKIVSIGQRSVRKQHKRN